MSWFNQFVSNLGAQNAPFGFDAQPVVGAPSQDDPAYRSGMQMLGNIGMGMLASGERNPMRALGRSYLVAQNNAQEQNRNQFLAAEMLQAAEDKKKERARAEEERAKKNAWLKGISDPRQRAMLEAYPELVDNYIQATDPVFQQPEEPKLYNVGGALVDANGQVVYQGQGDSNVSAQVSERQAAAAQLGLDPNDPAYKSYILTGKMPREDQAPLTATDKKAILEADEAVQANTQAIDLLNSAISGKPGQTLNDKAGYGWNAGAQAWLARNDPTGFFDDTKGQNTTDLNNIVINQALGSLKSIFGGNPTEGERAILLDLQASIDKTPKERESIIKRAIAAATRRLEFNKQRAAELRGQTYYKPGGGGGAVTTPDGITIEEVSPYH